MPAKGCHSRRKIISGILTLIQHKLHASLYFDMPKGRVVAYHMAWFVVNDDVTIASGCHDCWGRAKMLMIEPICLCFSKLLLKVVARHRHEQA